MGNPSINREFVTLLHDERGTILTPELILIATTLLLGVIVCLATVRDSVISELSDATGAVQDLKQTYDYAGIVGHSGSTHGASFQDQSDFCDNADDTSGTADNCISFDQPPVDESIDSEPPPTFVFSEPGTFDFGSVVTGIGGSASGTIGDGTVDTGFTVTTDTGNITGTTAGNQLRFRETAVAGGTITITYDDPLTEFEFFVRDLINVAGEPENILGNFTLTLSDGTVINNAQFEILPDAIGPNMDYGLFETRGNDQSQIVAVNRGGFDYVTDATFNGTPDQSAGRLIFLDVPASSTGVGVSSLSFERSGGPGGSFQAAFSTSGQVITTDP